MVGSTIILLADLDYFFAQCEELRNPDLKIKPVVVGVYSGRTQDSGAVSTANYVARKYGVNSGIPLHLARKRLQNVDAVFLPVDYKYYKHISDEIMAQLRSYSDLFEQVGIDEAYLDVSKKVQGSFKAAGLLVEKIKNEVKKKIGISFSMGIGPNKLVAKIAADSNKPDGLTIVKPSNVNSFLESLPVSRLPGIGKKTSQKMNLLGINTIGDLAHYDVQSLIDSFGRNLGVYYHNSANGVNNEPVHEANEAESISRISTLKENTRDLSALLDKTDQLILSIHRDLLNRNSKFKRVGVIAIMANLSVRSKSKTLLSSSDQIDLLKKSVQNLLESLIGESEMKIRRIGVKISEFTSNKETQKQLSSYF
ncbi:MAG: DNA polymerase IV [Candidatus Bathyarchaeota archaeon]|nr:DNA polymerase IV [Candidatus Bathyarchaeota archaeon]